MTSGAWAQCCLPIASGGLGYQSTKNTSSVAYVASLLESYDSLKSHFANELTYRRMKCIDDMNKDIDDIKSIRFIGVEA